MNSAREISVFVAGLYSRMFSILFLCEVYRINVIG